MRKNSLTTGKCQFCCVKDMHTPLFSLHVRLQISLTSPPLPLSYWIIIFSSSSSVHFGEVQISHFEFPWQNGLTSFSTCLAFYCREQPDSLDVISVRSATTCDPRRSATPRLLKVIDLLAFSSHTMMFTSRAAFSEVANYCWLILQPSQQEKVLFSSSKIKNMAPFNND